jgi:hypothetical protein
VEPENNFRPDSNPVAVKAPPQKKKQSIWGWLLIIIFVPLVFLNILSAFFPEENSPSVRIDSWVEAENYALQIITANIPGMAEKINKEAGYELFALGPIDAESEILAVSTDTGERVEGYFILYVEGHYSVFDIVVTYGGDVYFSDVFNRPSGKTALTAIYKKLYDIEKGWMLG